MTDSARYIGMIRSALIGLIILFFLVKTYLYYKYERERHANSFFYFTPIQIKLTNSRSLRRARKKQNNLSRTMAFFLLVFLLVSLFRILVIDK